MLERNFVCAHNMVYTPVNQTMARAQFLRSMRPKMPEKKQPQMKMGTMAWPRLPEMPSYHRTG